MDDLFIVARILRPHGRRGEVVVRPFTDHLSTLTKAERVFIGQEQGYPLRVLGTRMHKGSPLFLLEGIDSIDRAESLRGKAVCLPREELLPLAEEEYFLHDLVGLTLLDHEGEEVGKVDLILETGGPPLLEGGRRDGTGRFMVPFAPGTIRWVDLEEGTITLVNLPGLADGDHG